MGTKASSFGRRFADLTAVQQRRMISLTKATEEVSIAESKLGTAQVVQHRAIVNAMRDGVSAAMVAETVGLSVSRVYRIKEEMSATRRSA